MTFNIINIGFSGKTRSTYIDLKNYVSDGDNNDLLYWLGTEYGTAVFSQANINTKITTSGAIVPAGNFYDNNTSTFAVGSGAGTLSGQIQFNTVIVRPTRFSIFASFNNTGITTGTVEASVDGTTFETLDTWFPTTNVSTNLAGTWYTLVVPQIKKYYKSIRITIAAGSSRNLHEVKVYGDVKRTDGGFASEITPPTALSQFPDFIPNGTPVDGDVLTWEAGVMSTGKNQTWRTLRQTLAGNVVIVGTSRPNFLIYDTGGTNRTVTLPTGAINGQAYRIRNLSTANTITVIDPAGPTNIVALNGTTLKLAECIFDGTSWVVTTF